MSAETPQTQQREARNAIGQQGIKEAIKVIQGGGLIAYPTESVWGIGCNALEAEAVDKIRAVKKRSEHKGFIVLFSDLDQLKQYLPHLKYQQIDIIIAALDKPTTWLVANEGCFSKQVTGANTTVAIRVTSHPVAKMLCQKVGVPIISSSANISGEPTPATLSKVQEVFKQGLDYYLDGELGELKTPSQIQELDSGKIIRPGYNK